MPISPDSPASVPAATPEIGIVVLHGFGGTAASVAPLTDALRAAGHPVVSPTLPGHGTTTDDL
ncbi:MAG TPA: hypothetical protein PLV68_05065, partial [Ilumatobacteraceae bacterium]|nr:hypothetical protein [Ilumatobacteraceae bacterium]